jgi:hypothetical protein
MAAKTNQGQRSSRRLRVCGAPATPEPRATPTARRAAAQPICSPGPGRHPPSRRGTAPRRRACRTGSARCPRRAQTRTCSRRHPRDHGQWAHGPTHTRPAAAGPMPDTPPTAAPSRVPARAWRPSVGGQPGRGCRRQLPRHMLHVVHAPAAARGHHPLVVLVVAHEAVPGLVLTWEAGVVGSAGRLQGRQGGCASTGVRVRGQASCCCHLQPAGRLLGVRGKQSLARRQPGHGVWAASCCS